MKANTNIRFILRRSLLLMRGARTSVSVCGLFEFLLSSLHAVTEDERPADDGPVLLGRSVDV